MKIFLIALALLGETFANSFEYENFKRLTMHAPMASILLTKNICTVGHQHDVSIDLRLLSF